MSKVRVSHAYEELEDEEEVVMTLKDSSVLENSEDVLYNEKLYSKQKAARNQQIKDQAKTKHNYSQEQSGILQKYDEVPEETGFLLDSKGNYKAPEFTESPKPSSSLEVPKHQASDYLSFKVPKKRKRAVELLKEDTDRNHMQTQYQSLKKNPLPKFKDDEEDLSEELLSALKTKKEVKVSTPSTIEHQGQEYSDSAYFLSSLPEPPPNPSFKLSNAKKGSVSVLSVSLPTERPTTQQASVAAQEHSNTATLGRGLNECLKMLRERGDLKTQPQFGRLKDSREEDYGDLRIEHRDEKGRLLTKKQAFRHQCYKYHNQRPSKNKAKKLLHHNAAESKNLKLDPSKGHESFKAAKNIMSKKKEPYLIIPT